MELVEDFISDSEEMFIIKEIAGGDWSPLKRRRVQHLGIHFDYGLRRGRVEDGVGSEIPTWCQRIILDGIRSGYFQDTPDQITIVCEWIHESSPPSYYTHSHSHTHLHI